MEVLTELEAESALRLLTLGADPDEVVLLVLKSREFNLAEAMLRDVQKILLKEQKRKAELLVGRTVWDLIKKKDKKAVKDE